MHKLVKIIICLLIQNTVNSQVFDVKNIQYNGNPSKYLNIVIMGDGFIANEQQDFIDKATNLTNYLFTQEPWSNYKNYFNVYAIKVISNESGVKHPNNLTSCATALVPVPYANPDNYFGSTFDNSGDHRLLLSNNSAAITNVLASNFPNYQQVVIIANTPYYGGGSIGGKCTVSTNASSNEIFVHELGHSAGGLADEYNSNLWGELPNRTQQSNPVLVKWKNWLTSPQIGINPFGTTGIASTWFKPTTNTCKMEILNVPYCVVCKERLIENLHAATNPIVSFSPSNTSTINSANQFLDFNLTELMKPIPNTLTIKWQLDNDIFNNNSENFQINQNNLAAGTHTLTATVIDDTPFVRTDNHSTIHFNTVTWTIQKNILGINTNSLVNQVGISVYPNPSTDKLNVEIDLKKVSSFSIDLISLDGKIIQTMQFKEMPIGKNINTFDVSKLASGNYIINIKIDGYNYNKNYIKR